MTNPARRRRLAMWGCGGLALLLGVVGAAAVAIVTATPRERTSKLSLTTELRNFREVDPERFYRSGQLDAEQITEAVERLGIRTIINLRGPTTSDSEWYREEIRASERLGVRHIDVRLSSRSIPQRDELVRLLDAYRDAPRPILVHCKDGADRSGEAAAIYQMEYMGKTKEEAREMLGFSFLHIGLRRPAIHYFLDQYDGEEWVRNEYRPCELEYFSKSAHCAPDGSSPAP